MNDCYGIPPELSQEIFIAQMELRGTFRDSLRVGVRLGHLLTDAKAVCRHGDFGKWLAANFEGSARHAQRCMELARQYPTPEDVPNMSLREALRLLSGTTKHEQQHFRHERLSRDVVHDLLDRLPQLVDAVKCGIVQPLEMEGITDHHAAMKSAKKINSAIRRLADYLRAEFTEEKRDPQPTSLWDAMAFMDLCWPCTMIALDEAYRRLAKVYHPDAGGSNDQFVALTRAYETIKAAITNREPATA
jgi:hypothetical protein